MAYTIDKSLYEGRTFDPIFESTRTPDNIGPVNTPGNKNGANELVCIHFTTPAKVGSLVGIHAGQNPDANWGSDTAHGLPCMISVTQSVGDFSHNATATTSAGEARLDCVVGKDQRGYLRLEANTDYIVNSAPKEQNVPQGMRVQLTIS